MADITDHEIAEFDQANGSGRTPVVFVHGLWLLPTSWDRWRTVFERAGYATRAPGWSDDPETVEEAKEHPEIFAHKTVGPGRRPLRTSSGSSQRSRPCSATPSAACS